MWYALSISNNSCIIHIVSCLYFITKQCALSRNKSKTSFQITSPKYCTECFVFCVTYSVWCPGAGTEAGPQSDIARIQLPYYSEVRHITELPTLSERHRKRCLNFTVGLPKALILANGYHHASVISTTSVIITICPLCLPSLIVSALV